MSTGNSLLKLRDDLLVHLTLNDGTDRLSQNNGKELPLHAV